jgi:hypothetical protein
MERMMRLSCNVRDRYGRLAIVIAATLLAFGAVPPALASPPTCDSDTYYDVFQRSLNSNYISITSGITDPMASQLPGTDSNHDNQDHILLWDGIVEESIPAGHQPCGPGIIPKCWLQAGVGIGWVATSKGQDFRPDSLGYAPYAEWSGPNGGYYVHFFDGITINENWSVHAAIIGGSDGTYSAEVQDSSGNWHVLTTRNLYTASANAAAHSEILDGVTTTCPTLTNGSPYQNNGTKYDGTIEKGDKLVLTDSNLNQGAWDGFPTTHPGMGGGQTLYWFTKNSDWPASFQANGPSNNPP